MSDGTSDRSQPASALEILNFLELQGIREPVELIQLRGGANNRVFRVSGRVNDWALKSYFQNPADSRDRFGAEKAFYAWAWSQGVRRTPEPLAWSASLRLALFTFIHGRKLEPSEVNEHRVGEALDFVTELNARRASDTGTELPKGSEASFSLADHLALVRRRVARLKNFARQDALDETAFEFVNTELDPVWREIEKRIGSEAGPIANQELRKEDWWISPSDFGFHNAILAPDGNLRFFDFEYAGWDDPAKLICDFFCQPECPVPTMHWDKFLEVLARHSPGDSLLRFRASLLLPAYQVKWCCILLNDFVRADRARREFALGQEDPTQRKSVQLRKARLAIEALRRVVG